MLRGRGRGWTLMRGDPGGDGASGMTEGLLGMAVVSASEAHTYFLHIGRRSRFGTSGEEKGVVYTTGINLYIILSPIETLKHPTEKTTSLPPIPSRRVPLVRPPLRKAVLERRLVALHHVDHLPQAVLARRDGPHRVERLVARLPERLVVLVLLLHVEVDDARVGCECVGVARAPKQLAPRLGRELEAVGYGVADGGLLVGLLWRGDVVGGVGRGVLSGGGGCEEGLVCAGRGFAVSEGVGGGVIVVVRGEEGDLFLCWGVRW